MAVLYASISVLNLTHIRGTSNSIRVAHRQETTDTFHLLWDPLICQNNEMYIIHIMKYSIEFKSISVSLFTILSLQSKLTGN